MDILVAVCAVIAAGLVFVLVRFACWICRDGNTVLVPWHTNATPVFSALAGRCRTRDASGLSIREPGYCALVFMKRPKRSMKRPHRYGLDLLLFDTVTGGTGIFSTAVDFSYEASHLPWVVTSDALRTRHWRIDGPHFAPLAACAPAGFVSVDVSRYIDAHRLRDDLVRLIADPNIRHRGIAPFSYLFGRTRADRVTCSGFIGQAILRQEGAPLAAALRRALRERFTYGEIAPADLARAAAILGLRPNGSLESIRKVFIWERLRRVVSVDMRNAILLLAIAILAPLRAADPTMPVYWSAAQTQELDKTAVSRLNKKSGLGAARLLDSAFILYREGNSQAEIHTGLADFIFFREGEGAVIVGGKIVNGRPQGAGEIRGDSITGGTKYPVKAGDSLYVPKGTPHQFWLEAGQHFTATIVKITPKE
ncbi:MAG TPA: cupin domain-containing protein [Bryobacteraceae bacterium]|nr:cupin domain-containing protein [Bryobacteraceae bacterium]